MFSEKVHKPFNDPRRFNASSKTETKDDPANTSDHSSIVGCGCSVFSDSVSYGTKGLLISEKGFFCKEENEDLARLENDGDDAAAIYA